MMNETQKNKKQILKHEQSEDRVIFSIFPSHNYIDLNLYQSGREECLPGHIFGPARRNHYLFHYVQKGKGKLIAMGTDGVNYEFDIYPGQGFLLYPSQMATYYADEDDPWIYEWIEFDGLRVKETLELTTLTVNHPVYKPHNLEQRDKMVFEMDDIVRNSQGKSPLWTIGHLFLFLNALFESCRKISEKKGSALADFYVKEAISYIEQNFREPVSVEGIADSLGIDRSYFGKLFKRIMGKSPQQFLIQYRLVKAAEQLKATDKTIAEIAKEVGYENPLHFSRSFKEYYGESPKTWRKKDH